MFVIAHFLELLDNTEWKLIDLDKKNWKMVKFHEKESLDPKMSDFEWFGEGLTYLYGPRSITLRDCLHIAFFRQFLWAAPFIF